MSAAKRVFYGLTAVLVFVFSLQLLTASTSELAPFLRSVLSDVITDDLSALGSGWFASYMLLNGSTVAAVGLAFLREGILDSGQYFLLASGSRLGATFIVVLIGVLEYFSGENESIVDSVSVGILSFLVTYSVYIPATAAGYLLTENLGLGFLEVQGPAILRYSLGALFSPSVRLFQGFLGPSFSLAAAVAFLFLALNRFDRAFADLGRNRLAGDYVRFLLDNRWLSLLAGGLLTVLTASVSLSLGLIVPLYNQDLIRREEVVPYILGANVTTLVDTLLAATVVGTEAGMRVLLVLGLAASAVTVLFMLFYDRYFRGLKFVFDRLMTDDRAFAGFSFMMVAVPLFLVLL
ncbi:MAG: sodium:phosphate symporter [Candidatus Nanohaloarchaea archaeon]